MQARWLMLLVFVLPFFDSNYALHANLTAVGLSLLSLAACALLLSGLGGPLKRTLWAWVILYVFVAGYYLKNYLIATPPFHDRYLYYLVVASESTMVEAYYYFSISFALACITMWICLRLRGPSANREHPQAFRRPRLPREIAWVVTAAVLASIVVNVIIWRTGMGVMGSTWARWPLLLDSLVLRIKSDLVPAILLLATWACGLTGRRLAAIVCTVLFVLHMSIGTIVSASRGGISYSALALILLWAISGRISGRRLAVFAGMVAASVFLFPYLSSLRAMSTGQRYSRTEGLSAAMEVYGDASTLDTVGFGAANQLARTSGVDCLWVILPDVPSAPSLDRTRKVLITNGLANYVTRELYGIKSAGDYRAASLVGAFLVIGGPFVLIILSVLYPLGVYVLWDRIGQLASGPPCLVWFGLFLLGQTGEGTFRTSSWFAFGLTIVICEFLARRWLPPSRAVIRQRDPLYAEIARPA
jgi:hypothetical protein